MRRKEREKSIIGRKGNEKVIDCGGFVGVGGFDCMGEDGLQVYERLP